MCNAYNHPPGCTCGWGGEGHAGTSYGGWSYTRPSHWAGVTREWREPDFTRPTKCPICKKDVFFIRHNGGCVWVDELGWPWPKHPCFDKPGEPTHRFTLQHIKALRLHQPQLAVIRRISGDGVYDEPKVEVQFTDSTSVTLVLRSTPSDFSIVGSLVVISEADRLLVHPTYGEIAFHSLSHIPCPSGTHYPCPRCKAYVQHGTGHEDYCRTHYRPPAAAKSQPTKPTIPPQPPKWQRIHQRRMRPIVFKPRPKNRPVPKPAVIPPPPPPPPPRTLEGRIQLAVEQVAQQAWGSVAGVSPAEEQLRRAKQKVLELVAMLSPHIKRQVGNAFTSNKWQPLLSRRPYK